MDNRHAFLLDEAGLARLAALIALELRSGDAVALSGDLGAGKTTFARAAIRARLGDDVEVPSPTFSLAQPYETAQGRITHYDFYRLESAGEAAELGVEAATVQGAVLVEWPERALTLLPDDRLDVKLEDSDGGARRQITLEGRGRWGPRIERLLTIREFLERTGWGAAGVNSLPGDASSRRYFRFDNGRRRALLMDAPRQPDGPPVRDGKPYSRIAHLAEDVGPFVAVAQYLRRLGLSAPEILASDLEAGLLLVEDLGDRVYGGAVADGAELLELWRAAVDALLVLHRTPATAPLPIGDGGIHSVPLFDRMAMQIEVELLPDWYAPAMMGSPLDAHARVEFLGAWHAVFERLSAMPSSLVLRDYHSPNLLWLPDRTGPARVGIIDFQDALIAHPAYDLVSLLQDARLDVPPEMEAELLAYYRSEAEVSLSAFDSASFDFAYRALGAQRNTKILGIFFRLATRDRKPRYLQHIPRIWRYLERDLAQPELSSVRAWYDRYLPDHLRGWLPTH